MAKGWRAGRLVAGLIAGFAAPIVLGEAFLRARPPSDIHLYLEDAPTSGPYRSDAVLGVDYRSYSAFEEIYDSRLRELLALQTQPTWLFFGSSFVQAPGMLGDTMQALRPGHRMFYLRRNEPPHVRVAQARQLVRNGLRPERVFFVLLPLDISTYGTTPLNWIKANANGAVTHRMRLPPAPVDRVVANSLFALTGWVRSGRHRANPDFRAGHVRAGLSPQLQSDWRQLLEALGEMSRAYAVPVTLVLVPDREQILAGEARLPQDILAQIGRGAGLDVLDVGPAFLSAERKQTLFLPDWHFSAEGNRILAGALLEHVSKPGVAAVPSIAAGAR